MEELWVIKICINGQHNKLSFKTNKPVLDGADGQALVNARDIESKLG